MNNRKKGAVLFAFLILGAGGIARAADFNETTRLAALAKVWGFMKYYHPEVAKGELDWDKTLVDVYEKAKSAGSRDEFQPALNELFFAAGNVNFLNFPAPLPDEPNDDPLFAWMRDETFFGTDLRLKMELLIETLPFLENAYAVKMPVGNLDFSFDNRYAEGEFPNESRRMVALFRYWNIIRYFFPYTYLIEGSWEDVLEEFIPVFRACEDAREYHLAVRLLTARIEDTHASMYSPVLSETWGLYYPPFEVRHVEDRTIVTKIYTHLPASAGGLAAGDIILSADGVPVSELRASKAAYVNASNEPARQRNLNDLIFRGPGPDLDLVVDRFGQSLDIHVIRCQSEEFSRPAETAPPWSILDGNIGYVHMGVLLPEHVDGMIAALLNTRAIVFDIRNYPNGTLYHIARYLNREKKPFVKFTFPLVYQPGHFSMSQPLTAGPDSPVPYSYRGEVVLLVDERTQSHAEFTAMCLQTAPSAVTIGSQTAGADGDVSRVWLPGGITTYFTGLGIYYPDGSETQKVGVRVDLTARPTVAGIRAGRDDVLEKALEYLKERLGGLSGRENAR